MFCKYCGRELKEGEVCTCRQQRSNISERRMEQKKQGVQKKQIEVERKTGMGLSILSFLFSILVIISFILLRVVFRDIFTENGTLEGIYPYLIYILPVLFGGLALLCAVFSLRDKRIHTASIVGIMVSVIFTAGIIVSSVVFPYEPEEYQIAENKEADVDTTDIANKEKNIEKEEEKVSGISQIEKDYKNGSLDYIKAKLALGELNIETLDETQAEQVLAFQNQIENDLEEQLSEAASVSDYKEVMETLSALEEEAENNDELLIKLHEKYEPEYILYLDTESRKMAAAGKKEDAVKLLEEGMPLVDDKDAISDLILEVQNTDGANEYILPDSNKRYLTEEDISGLTIQQINYAKNEIYARYGRRFQSNELQTYFNSKSWYSGAIEASDFNEGLLNEYEKKNVEFLSKKEFAMESGGYKLDAQ